MTILDEIFEAKKRRVADRRRTANIDALISSAFEKRASVEAHRFRHALSATGINIIAEFKRASPSKGIINDHADPAHIAKSYMLGGAKAISVLTEENYFRGSLEDLQVIGASMELPILQKDFIFDRFQIYEAAAAGADAILLIVAMLGDSELTHLYQMANKLGMDALVEVHNEEEMKRAAALGSTLIGINNRNLKTFEVTLDTSRVLIERAPAGAIMVSESGLESRDHLLELNGMGFNGFLIGETLMKSADPQETLRGLTG